jgi:hypothetical protein
MGAKTPRLPMKEKVIVPGKKVTEQSTNALPGDRDKNAPPVIRKSNSD